MSVQYHPEASPGPHDSQYLFDQFMEMVKQGAGDKGQITGSKAPGEAQGEHEKRFGRVDIYHFYLVTR